MLQDLLKISAIYLIAILFTIINLNGANSDNFFAAFLPSFEIMIIYYFCVYKEDVFGLWFVFFIGFLSDALVGAPLGISSLIYIIIVKLSNIIAAKQAPKEDFISIFKEFVIFLNIILILKWLALSIYYKNFYNLTPFIIQIIISAATYILMHRFFEFLSKKLLPQE